MATIVKMPAARPRIHRETEDEGSATILFFTGVRYCRDDESDVEAATEAAVLAEVSIQAAEAGVLAFN